MSIPVGFFLALLVTAFLIPLAGRLGYSLGIIDSPNARKVHHKPIPRTGGIAIFLGVTIALLALQSLDDFTKGYIGGALCLLVFGVWDDYKDIDFKIKFAGQIMAGLIFLHVSGMGITTLGELIPGHVITLGYLSAPVSIFFLLATINIINFSDGLDALAGGISLLVFISIFGLSFLQQSEIVLVFVAILGGAVVGFLLYNIHPAMIFLGDAGSQFLGFSIGALLIATTQDHSIYSPVLPLFIIGVPIIDTASVMLYRLSQGKSIFHADKNHLHHKLLHSGLTHTQSVIILYIIHFILVVAGWIMKFSQDYVVLIAYLALSVALYNIFFIIFRYRKNYILITIMYFYGNLYNIVMSSNIRYNVTKYAWIIMLLCLSVMYTVPTAFIAFSHFNLLSFSFAFFIVSYLKIKKHGNLDHALRIISFMFLCYYVYVITVNKVSFELLNQELLFSNVLFYVLTLSFIPCLLLTPEKKPFDVIHVLSIAFIIFIFLIHDKFLSLYNMPFLFVNVLLIGWVINLIFSRIDRNRKVIFPMVLASLALGICFQGYQLVKSL